MIAVGKARQRKLAARAKHQASLSAPGALALGKSDMNRPHLKGSVDGALRGGATRQKVDTRKEGTKG